MGLLPKKQLVLRRKDERSTKKTNVVTNIFYQISYELFAMLLPLFTAPFISRILGADMLGVYSYSRTLATYFGLFGMLGVKNYGNREISRHRDDKDLNLWFWSIYAVQFFASLAMLVLYIGYTIFFVVDNQVIAAVQSILIVDSMLDISWFLFGMEQFKKTTTCSTIVKLLTTTAVFLLVREPGDLLEYCLIMGGGVFINQFMLWYYARQAIGKPVFNLKRSLAHGKPMLILFIPVIAVSLYTMMDKLMLGAMSTKAQLGFYEAAEKIILCASSVITAFGTVMMPRMTKLFSDGNVRESQRYMKLSVEAVMAGSFAISLGILSVSRLFAPIFWGKDFASCAYILSALALSIPFSGFANVIRMQYLIPNGMDRAYIVSVILGAVSNLIANSLLISIYGALGAALGTVIAEGIVCIAQCFAVRKRISLQKYLNCIVPFGVAGLIMAAAVRVIDHVAIVTIPWLLIEIFVGSIVYCSLSLLYLYYTRNELLMAGIQKFSKR